MSHFTVMVKVNETQATNIQDVIQKIPEILYPYCEHSDHFETFTTLRPGASICQIKNLDTNAITIKMLNDANDYWYSYEKLRKTGDNGNNFRGPRYTAITLGLCQCKNADEMTKEELKHGIKWNRQIKKNIDRYDIYNQIISKEEFLKKYLEYFNPIRTYAVVDKDGWYSSGEMGWFGVSSDTVESKLDFVNSFYKKFIKNSNQNDWIAIVDCHI